MLGFPLIGQLTKGIARIWKMSHIAGPGPQKWGDKEWRGGEGGKKGGRKGGRTD